jgi:hypothetical protein
VDDGNDNAGEVVKVTFRGLRSDVPFAVRLRHLLKRALRDWQLRCRVAVDIDQAAAKLEQHAEALNTHMRQHA